MSDSEQHDGQRTSLSLLQGLREHDAERWARFADVYSPLVYEWCRRAGVSRDHAPDVVQEIFSGVARDIGRFRRDRASDSFHGWLRQITRHKVLDHFRRLAKQPAGKGGSSAQMWLNQHPDSLPAEPDEASRDSELQSVYFRVLEVLKLEFESHTWQSFWRVTVDGVAPVDAAAELGMTVGAVYNAKSKVLRRLRDEFDGLLPLDRSGR